MNEKLPCGGLSILSAHHSFKAYHQVSIAYNYSNFASPDYAYTGLHAFVRDLDGT